MTYDLSKVTLGTNGMVQTGAGSLVQQDALSDSGYEQAVNYNINKDKPTLSNYTGPGTGSPSGMVSSASPIIGNQQNQAMASATNSLIGGSQQSPYQYSSAGQNQSNQGTTSSSYDTGGVGGIGNWSDTYTKIADNLLNVGIKALNANQQTTLQNAALANQALQLDFNTNLAGLNQQYSQNYQQLQIQHQNAVGSAMAQIAGADPFGINSSSANSQYVGKINDMFGTQATFLNNAYQAQQVALQNGAAKAALGIQQQINDATAQFNSGISNLVTSIGSSMVSTIQNQQSKQLQAASQYRLLLNQTDTSQYQNMTPEELQQVLPGTAIGMIAGAAGISPQQMALDVKTSGTQATGQSSLELAKSLKTTSINTLNSLGITDPKYAQAISSAKDPAQIQSVMDQAMKGNNTGQNNEKSFSQYGLLTNTDFNPNNEQDQRAYKYLDYVLKEGKLPNSGLNIGISSKTGQLGQNMFNQAAERANDLYYNATGSSIPDPQILAGNKKIAISNNKLSNNIDIQEKAIQSNFGLNLENLTAKNLNQSIPVVNKIVNAALLALGDENVSAALAQNQTIQNELGNLLAVRNANGTTVADKLAGAGLLGSNLSTAQQANNIKQLVKEAGNLKKAIQDASADVYKQTDPLLKDPNNPLRAQYIKDNPTSTGSSSKSVGWI